MSYRRGLPCALLLFLMLSGCGPTLQVQVQNGPASPAAPAPNTGEGGPAPAPQSEEAECAYPTAAQCVTEELLATTVTYLTFFAELCGALVIAVAVIRGLLRFIPHIFGWQRADDTFTEDIRLQLGKSLALALEFELGADILKTAIAPTLPIIAQLAAIAILRTFLNYFLERELRQAEQRRAGQHLDTAQGEGTAGAQVYPADRDRPSLPHA